MNTLGTALNRKTFSDWFAKIDADGSEEISLQELTLALSGILKVDVPNDRGINTHVPDKLV